MLSFPIRISNHCVGDCRESNQICFETEFGRVPFHPRADDFNCFTPTKKKHKQKNETGEKKRRKKGKNSDSKNGIHNRFEIYLYPVPREFILMREFQQCVIFIRGKVPAKSIFFKFCASRFYDRCYPEFRVEYKRTNARMVSLSLSSLFIIYTHP